MSFKKALILGLILSAHMVLTAQTNFKPGYIIKNSADTLYGKIDYRGDLLMGSICRFKSENEGLYKAIDLTYNFEMISLSIGLIFDGQKPMRRPCSSIRYFAKFHEGELSFQPFLLLSESH